MLPRLARPRLVALAIVVAALLGFAAGWLARVWTYSSMEDRARGALEDVRERAREMTK